MRYNPTTSLIKLQSMKKAFSSSSYIVDTIWPMPKSSSKSISLRLEMSIQRLSNSVETKK